VAKLGYRIAGEEPPQPWSEILGSDKTNMHFEYPGSTHSCRLESDMPGVTAFAHNTEEAAFSGNRSLKLIFDYANGGFGCRAYIKTYYTPEDFNDSHYDPSFSPLIYIQDRPKNLE
jgi:hypothetical protein